MSSSHSLRAIVAALILTFVFNPLAPAEEAPADVRLDYDQIDFGNYVADHDHAGHDHVHGDGHFATHRADAHAPAGVMGEHMHAAGEWMVGYNYMVMHMDGNRNGTSRLSDAQVRGQGFPVVPTDMQMHMHMLGVMYAPLDEVNVMVMIPFVHKSMNHIAGMPLGAVRFKTETSGIGDVAISSLVKLFRSGGHRLHANLGLTAPTGRINHRDMTPMGNVILPYPMQNGSGTVDLQPGATYMFQAEQWSAGAQVIGTIRLGRNYRGYTLGDKVNATAWFAWSFLRELSVSVRLNYEWWDDIDGRDPSLMPALVPTADTARRGGQRLDVLLGINGAITDGPLKGLRVAIEGGVPVYQDLDGPQLGTDFILYFTLQYAF